MIPDSDLIDFLAKGCLPEGARLRQERGLLFNGPDGGDQDDVEAQQVHVHPDHQGAQAHCKSGVQHPEHNERGRLRIHLLDVCNMLALLHLQCFLSPKTRISPLS